MNKLRTLTATLIFIAAIAGLVAYATVIFLTSD